MAEPQSVAKQVRVNGARGIGASCANRLAVVCRNAPTRPDEQPQRGYDAEEYGPEAGQTELAGEETQHREPGGEEKRQGEHLRPLDGSWVSGRRSAVVLAGALATVSPMSPASPAPAGTSTPPHGPVAEVVRLAQIANAARSAARDAAAQRDAAVVAAVRAGASLREISFGAALTRAAVSHIARKTLPARPPDGGPYARRRGSHDAVEVVALHAAVHREALATVESAVADRDRAIAKAVASGAGIREISRAASLPVSSVSLAARSHRS